MFDLEQFLDQLRNLPHRPTNWTDLRTDAPVITLADLARPLRTQIAELDQQINLIQRQARRGGAPVADGTIETLDQQREALLDEALWMEHPDHIHLATGHTIRYDGANTGLVDPWVTHQTEAIRFGKYERFQLPGIHPSAQVHPTARVHPSARIDSDAVIGPHAEIGPHAYISASSMLGAGVKVGGGAWIGTHTTLSEGTRIGPGACIRSNGMLGQHTNIGAAAELPDGAQLARHSTVGAAQHLNQPQAHSPYRATQFASAIDRLLTIDRG